MYSAYETLMSMGETGRAYYKKAIDALSELDFSNSSEYIITIAYGGNDSSSSVPLGEVDSMDKRTLYGSMNYVIKTLLQKYPDIDVRIVTPTYVSYSKEKDESGNYVSTEDSDSRLIGEYTRREYCKKIYEHALELKIPAYDMYNRGGRNKYNIYSFTVDGIHPTTELAIKDTANRYLCILSTF